MCHLEKRNMKTISLIGKKYEDTLLSVEKIVNGETNMCKSIEQRLGGMYNFRDAKISSFTFNFCPIGIKSAFIINDQQKGIRTSFVKNQKVSSATEKTVANINDKSDWLHICYLDDIEDYDNFYNLNIPFSVDFCTLNKRTPYIQLMEKAEVIFDSRERKKLYDSINIKTPIVLHDEKGVEIIINNSIVSSFSMNPLKNLNVNGAGDIYAAHFIDNYFNMELNKSTYCAMIKTTKSLIEKNNEKI